MDPEGERLDGFESATKLMESDKGRYNLQDVEALKTFFEIQAGQLRLLRYSWNEDDKSIPGGWRSRYTGSKMFILSPSGQQFPSRLAILQTLLQDLGINGGGLKRTVFHHLRQKYLQMLLLIGLPSSSRSLPPLGGSCTSGILQLITGSTFT